ncbi:hypothetical protein M9Y10_025546 [Tritrichomonas musculus]|uniref:Right handed beta helix domain-containing protein n=1 Tax=Tritrichomonas musculus TaxID=1915356 RepID=A0ABR2H9V7_9EUKA
MLIFLFYIYGSCGEYITEINGADTDFCHILSPCSFSRVKKKIESKDIVFVKGNYIGEPDELDQIRDLFDTALSKGAIITSDNMTINGTKYKSNSLAFIIVQSTADSRINNFHFTGFSCSIACFRTVEKGVISNSYFTHNHVIGGIGLLSFGVGKCKLDECVLTENTVLNSSLITMFSTHLYLNLTIIERNLVKSTSRQALLFAINSVCEYTNTTIRYNSSPHAPLHQFEFRSCFGFWNCTFEFNKNPEIMLCDGTCEFNFTNTTISNNMGSFLTTSVRSVVSFNESLITHNFSGDRPLFYLPGCDFSIFHPCLFIENYGHSIIDTTGVRSKINIKNGVFKRNKALTYVIGLNDNSKIEINDSKFNDNMAQQGTIYSKKSTLIISNSSFWKNRDSAVRFFKGKAYLSNINFYNNFGNDNSSTINLHSAYLSVTNCRFKGISANGHIYATGNYKMKLFNLDFSGIKKYSLNNSLHASCIFCSFNTSKSQSKTKSKRLFLLFIVLLVILLLLVFNFFFKRKTNFFKLKQENIDENHQLNLFE